MSPAGKRSLEELLADYGKGGAASFREFFARTRAVVYGYLRKRLPSGEAADDVFQDTYFRVHRYVTSFDPSGNALAWLLRIAHSCLNDHLRKRYRTPEVATENVPEAALDARGEDAVIIKDLLLQATIALTDDEIRLILERFVEGDSYDDIAERRSWTAVNARQRLSRALRKLKVGTDA